jgi:hypothetical protein
MNTIKYSDIISFENDITIDNFLLYIVNDTLYLSEPDKNIAFGYSFNDTTFSFIHMLYQKQLISHKEFGFVFTYYHAEEYIPRFNTFRQANWLSISCIT